ncbi:molecular chaperone DnaJ [Paenibacillus dendritiformis]|uniref:molecular chaperone DnaJ n=2 Tax=Paenibacillus dendritiformis TaxID=130049 RepID=UPI001F41C884|nr:molecular chaperone DnaJ [Paenibacillus dendritiformis]
MMMKKLSSSDGGVHFEVRKDMEIGREDGYMEGAQFANVHDSEGVTVTEPYIVEFVRALMNLNRDWQNRVKAGTTKLQFAVQIGSRLTEEQQERLMEFLQEVPVPEKDMGKVLHAFELEMPEWAVRQLLRIYRLADRLKATLIMYNDLMEQLEQIMRNFEFEFWEGSLPREEERLEATLEHMRHKLSELADQAPRREQSYNRSYGDSSSNSWEHRQAGAASYHVLIGVPEEADEKQVRKQSKKLLKLLHPDHGGSAYLFDWVKKAYDDYSGNGESQKKGKRSPERRP